MENSAQRTKRTSAIIVGTSETTYAETLKKLREEITDEETLNEIKKVRKTQSGNLMLTVTENNQRVKGRVQEMFQGRKVRSVGGNLEKTIHIRDIDAVTTRNEIEAALGKTGMIRSGVKPRVGPLRPTTNGNQVVTVILNGEDAKNLLEVGKLRLGLTLCRMEERIEVVKCYRCWGYGHKASVCKDEDMTDRCQRCTGTGHKREGCQAEPFCPHCKKTGHSAGSGGCRAFREALAEARKTKMRIVRSQ